MNSHLARQRNKPLRTYGRRSVSTPELRGEPASKKRRTGDGKSEDESEDTTAVLSLPEPPVKTQQIEGHGEQVTIKKGSILSYFRPITSSSRSATPTLDSEKLSPAIDPPSSPPSSPPSLPTQPQTRTKRRRLRIRAIQLPSSDPPDPAVDEDGECLSGTQRGLETRGEETEARKPLAALSEELDNHGQERDPRNPKKRRSVPLVQTTLNLSAQAPFSECKVCDTVWNPVIPEDAKYHSRRHAAVLRARKKKNGKEL